MQFTHADLARLRCYSQWAEVNLVVNGVPQGTVAAAFTTDLPGAVQDVSLNPRAFSPGATMVLTRQLLPDTPYFVEVWWGPPGASFTANFAPIRPASPQSIIEKHCTHGPPQCMFPVTNGWHDMIGGTKPLGGVYAIS